MLCSNCSAVVKPIVAIDIDGTLGDYHGHFLDFAYAYLGAKVPPIPYQGREPFGDWFCHQFEVDRTEFRKIKLAYRQGGLKRTMPPKEGATLLVEELRRHGAEVWLTTTRPYMRLDNVDPDTRFWLDQQRIVFDGMLYDEDKYKVLAELVDPARVVAVVDDLLPQCQAASAAFGKDVPIWMMSSYNLYEGWFENNVAFLSEAGALISNRISDWKAKNGTH